MFRTYLYRPGAVWRWARVTLGVRLKGWAFSSSPTWQSPRQLHCLWGFTPNEGFVGTGASLSGQIMVSVSLLLECLPFKLFRSVWGQSDPSRSESLSLFSKRFFLNILWCIVFDGKQPVIFQILFSGRQVYPVQQSGALGVFLGSNPQLALNSRGSSSITVRRSSQPQSFFNHQAHTMGRCVTARQWL